MRIKIALLLVTFCAARPAIAAPAAYHLLKTIPIPGAGGWDLLTMDQEARRVYIAHDTEVDVLDVDSGELTGKIPGIQGAHGVALADEFDRGFATNGKSNEVTIFTLKGLKTIATAASGLKPDAITYDPATQRIVAFNGGSSSATVIDAKDGKVIGTIELGGAPEQAVADGTGNVFVNLEDKDSLLKIDIRKLSVLERWPLAPGQSPTGLAIDVMHHRLFAGCRNKLLVVLNADTGKVAGSVPIGEKVDATFFDPATGEIFSSNGDGTLAVIHEDNPDKYSTVETLTTRAGSKTMALDTKLHQVFIPAAEFQPGPPPTAENPRPRPMVVPGTLSVLVFGR